MRTRTTTKTLSEIAETLSTEHDKRKMLMLNVRETRQYLKESEFETLFTQELGWGPSHPNTSHHSR